MIDLLNLLPRKPTCPLKINGWKMYIFPIEIVPFLADMLVFRGVNLQFTGVLHPNECHESFLKHQLMSGCFPVGASLNHCCRHFFRMGRWELARNIGRVQKTWSFWRKKGDKYGIIYIYICYVQFAAKFAQGIQCEPKSMEIMLSTFTFIWDCSMKKNKNTQDECFPIALDYWDRLWCSLEKRKNRHVLSLSWDKSRRIFRVLDVDISIFSGCTVWQNKEGHLTGNQYKSAYLNITGHHLMCYDESEYHLASFFYFFE